MPKARWRQPAKERRKLNSRALKVAFLRPNASPRQPAKERRKVNPWTQSRPSTKPKVNPLHFETYLAVLIVIHKAHMAEWASLFTHRVQTLVTVYPTVPWWENVEDNNVSGIWLKPQNDLLVYFVLTWTELDLSYNPTFSLFLIYTLINWNVSIHLLCVNKTWEEFKKATHQLP